MLVSLTNLATTSASTTAITMTSAISIGIGGALVAVMLILLLSSRELITASTKTSKKVLKTLDSMIVPLLLAFVLTVAFQIIMVVNPLS
jgi:hypothetical protein